MNAQFIIKLLSQKQNYQFTQIPNYYLNKQIEEKSEFLESRYKTTNQLENYIYKFQESLRDQEPILWTMFNLYLKREQYGKVSSKFKNHFETRHEKVNFVNSRNNKLQQKMKAFNQLINDDFESQRKLSPINSSSSYDRKMPKLNSTQMFGDPSKRLLGEFNNWRNFNSNKSFHKENVSGWVNFEKEKQKRINLKIGYTSQKIFKKEIKKLKFLIDMKKKIEGIPSQEISSNHQSCQDKQSSCENQSIMEDKKKSKLKKHTKQLSQDLNFKDKNDDKNIPIKKNLKKPSINQTLFCDLKSYKSSLFKEEFEKNQSGNEDDFKDDSIQEKVSSIVNRRSFDEYVVNLDDKIERNLQTKSHQLTMNQALKPIKRQSYAHNLTGFLINPSKRKLAPLTQKKMHGTVILHNLKHL